VKLIVSGLALLLLLVPRPASAGNAPAEPAAGGASQVKAQWGAPARLANHADWSAYGFNFGPDGLVGAIPSGNGSYTFYGAFSSNASCSGTPNAKVGAFSFTGSLDKVTGNNGCKRLFGTGDGPSGWLFDRDYAGGGQVVPFTAGASSGWLMPFHGEYQWSSDLTPDHKCGGVPCFYSALGLAISTDNGKTFKVVGQIEQPSQPVSVFTGGATNMPSGYGSLVVADADGNHLDNPPPDPSNAYFYLFYDDLLPSAPGVCARIACLGIARAPYADLIAAALSGDPNRVATVFRKYDGASPDPWTQAATSDTPDQSGTAGGYAPLWTDEGAGEPEVIYDSAFGLYLVSYEFGGGFGARVELRTSRDLIHWSKPIGSPYTEEGRVLYQPTLIGETGDPTIGGASPMLYLTSFPNGAFPNWSNAVFESLPIELSSSP
jgi:hypothetical protein